MQDSIPVTTVLSTMQSISFRLKIKEILLHIFDKHESPRRKDPNNWMCKMQN
jgi:hypothetical protein